MATKSLQINGTRQQSLAATLADLIVEQGFSGQRVATALNGIFVPERSRPETTLLDGDTVEILSARQGG